MLFRGKKPNTAESEIRYAKQKEVHSKGYILNGLIYMTFWKRQMIGTEKNRSAVARGWGR